MAMPPHIKKNFIYRRVWNEIHELDSNANFIIIGKPGIGKSTVGQKICQDLDPTFNIDRVCYSIRDFLRLLTKGDSLGELKPGSAILFDEIVTDQGADSRSAMSRTNKLMNYINATFRVRRLIVVYCLPSLTQMDRNLRDINVTGIFEVLKKSPTKKKNMCKFVWSQYNAKTQKVFYIFPRLIGKNGQIYKVPHVWVGRPSREFELIYKAKKSQFLEGSLNRWDDQLERETNKKRKNEKVNPSVILANVKNNLKDYLIGNQLDILKIAEKENICLSYASSVTASLKKEIAAGILKLPSAEDSQKV